MIYGPAFYKLLGIPESVAEPTAYHLLKLDPRMITEALVDGALEDRKARLRQNIPGPQFIPIVSLIEQELEKAAAILRDPARRKEYDARLLRESRKKRLTRDSQKRRKLVEACRQAVRSMVDADGCLPDGKRGELASRLDSLGLPDDQVRYVLEHIPAPDHGEADASAEQRRRRRDEAMGFFLAAIDLEVRGGLLDGPGERKLMKMAERFDIPADLAVEKIDERLAALGAERGGRDESSLIGQFKLHVLAMFPMGDATRSDRKRLLSLAAAQGLSVRQAERTLREYLPPLEGEEGGVEGIDSSLPEEPLAVLRRLAAESAEAPVPGGEREGRYARYAVDVVVALVLAAATVGVWRAVEAWYVAAGPAPPGRPSTPQAAAAATGPHTRPALLAEAFRSLHAGARVRRLLRDATASVRAETLLLAADMLLGRAAPHEQASAERLYKALLGCPPADGRVQDAAVAALLGRLRAPGEAGAPQRKGLYRAAGLLASVLFLRPTPGVAVEDPAEMKAFLARCEGAWAKSRAFHPADPVNDPSRLADAVMGGGSLTIYAERADRARFAAVTAELARVAAEAQEPGSQEALMALLGSGGYGGHPAEIGQVARLALCDVMRATSDAETAARAQATLASALGLAYDDPLRSVSLDSPLDRAKTAAAFRRVVEAGVRALPGTRPAATQPESRPAAPPPRAAVTLADSVRATWTDRPTVGQALTDLAAAMLVCAERVARFTLRSEALTGEMVEVLKQADPALRASRLTKRVRLLEAAAAVPSGPRVLDDKLAEELMAGLRSSVPGLRNRAIEQLRLLDDTAAAAVLIERLTEIVQTARPDMPAMNRILAALVRMSDGGIPGQLARLIRPARSNYAAHRVVMALLEGSGYMGSANRRMYQLPINHNSKQRLTCAGIWKNLALSCPWGPGRLAGAVAGPVGPPPAWRPDPTAEKLLALFAYYSELTGQLLRAYKPAAGAEAPKPPEIRPAKADVAAPVHESQLAEALELMVAELTRLARGHEGGREFAVKMDMIALKARSRGLACETALQRAAVSLDTAGGVLEVLVLEADGAAVRETVAELRRRRDQAAADAENVLIEMREHCYYNLILLGMLPEDGP